jgi:hypothetical protein
LTSFESVFTESVLKYIIKYLRSCVVKKLKARSGQVENADFLAKN